MTALDLFPATPPATAIAPSPRPVQPPAAQRSPEGVSAAGAETDVGIYKITLGISTYAWFCAAHVAARRIAGWACDWMRSFPWLTCDDCAREAQP